MLKKEAKANQTLVILRLLMQHEAHTPNMIFARRTLTLMLLRLTSTKSGSFLFTLDSVSATSVELGSSSGTGLYWVHWITPGYNTITAYVIQSNEFAHKYNKHVSCTVVSCVATQQVILKFSSCLSYSVRLSDFDSEL